MITCEVLLPDASVWILVSIIFASNSEDLRKELWKEIEEVTAYNEALAMPWMVLGDFNQIRHPDEHSLAVSQNIDRKPRDFRECFSLLA